MKTILALSYFLVFCGSFAGTPPVQNFRALVRVESWTERWPDEAGESQPREVKAEVWTDAFQAILDEQRTLWIPAREQPYYLDAPLVLKSGNSIRAELGAEIRLKPGVNTCMIRNENIVGFADRPVSADSKPDTDLIIEGGIWTTLATGPKESNGNDRGWSAKQKPVPGTNGVILLQNVRGVTVRNVTVRQSKAFAVHLGNAREFVIDGVTLDRQRRDGVHVNGPASQGIIRNVQGDSADDTVALNAWEWENYAASFGPIHHILIEHVIGSPAEKHGTDAIRLLPGVKRFADNTTLDCPIHDIALRDITDIREFKFYDQPNLEHGRDKDFSITLGKLRDISLQRLILTRPGLIKVAAIVDGLNIDEADLRFAPAPDFKLVEIGPMSATYRRGPDPAKWVEIFSPDMDVTVHRFHLGHITLQGQPVPDAEARLVQVKDQQLNPDYPRTTPKGGTGKARVLP